MAKIATIAEKPATILAKVKSPSKTKITTTEPNKAGTENAAAAKIQTPATKLVKAQVKKKSTIKEKKIPKAAFTNRATIPDRIWLKSYPADIPANITSSPYSSIADLITASCHKYAERSAFACMGRSLTYAELEKYSIALAAWFQSQGLEKGDRVAIMMPNMLQYPIAIAAILRAGLIVVNVNPLYTPRELEYQLKDSGAKAIIILENFANTLSKILTKTHIRCVLVTTIGDMLGLKGYLVNFVVRKIKRQVPKWHLPDHISFTSALTSGMAYTFKPITVDPTDIAFLQYTGGTTGISKGAALLHSNILANIEQMRIWLEVAYRMKRKPRHLTFICALPLYHIFALTVNAMIGIEQGACNVLIPNPRDIPSFVKALQKVPFHFFVGLNTLFNSLLNNKDFCKIDFKSLILTLGGGMAVQRSTAKHWQDVTGCVIIEGYGLSETSPVVSANVLNATEFTGTIGLPLPSTEITIRNEDAQDLPIGEVGEICIRGPQVMQGYWNRPEETAHIISKDGFLSSGDIGFMDERGLTTIIDRKKDMILVSGFNVYPNEIEEVAAEHPGIAESAAIGVPNEHSGEVVKLFVVRRDPELTEDAVKTFCAERLTNYKRPRYVEFRDALPKTNVGKILRRELRGQ